MKVKKFLTGGLCLLVLAASICLPLKTGGKKVVASAEAAVTETSQSGGVDIPFKELGEYLPGTASSGSAAYAAKNAYNNSGMTGADGITHRHTNQTPAKKMWRTQEGAPTADSALTVTLDYVQQVGLMFVWNYNEQGKTDCGLRKADIYTSPDGETFTLATEAEFARASGTDATKATNLAETGLPVNLGGVTVKAVRIVPKETDGNWGGTAYGVSEIKLYAFRVPAAENAYLRVQPRNALASSSAQLPIMNGLGLSDVRTAKATHDNNPANMYSSAASTLAFDLGGSYPLSKLAIWNYNDPENLDAGIKEIEISYETDPSRSLDKWPKLSATVTVPKAGGSSAEPCQIAVDMENAMARFVNVKILSNYGAKNDKGKNLNGLSAVRFYCGTGLYADAAYEWTSLVSNYGIDGKTDFAGGDAFFSAALDAAEYKSIDTKSAGNKTVFAFADTTVLTGINEVTRMAKSMAMPNNSFAVFTGNDPYNGSVKFVYNKGIAGMTGNQGETVMVPSAVDRPNLASEHGRYWQGSMYVTGNKFYATPHYIRTVPYGMGFEQTGCDLAIFDLNKQLSDVVDFNSLRFETDVEGKYWSNFTWPTPAGEYESARIMNAGFFANTEEAGAPNPDGYVYNYGYSDPDGAGRGRNLIVGRTKPGEIEDKTKIEYYNGTNWVRDITKAAHLAANVSTELSVTPLSFGPDAGKYLLVYTTGTMTPKVAYRVGDTPWGPFSDEKILYHSTEPEKMNEILIKNETPGTPDCYCYNAKAHPALSKSGELLITYNMNFLSGGFSNGIKYNVDCYHPRFLRLSTTAARVSDGDITAAPGDGNNTDEKGCKGCGSAVSAGGGAIAGAALLVSAIALAAVGLTKRKN